MTELIYKDGLFFGRPTPRKAGTLCSCESSPPGVVVKDDKGKYCGGCGGEFPSH